MRILNKEEFYNEKSYFSEEIDKGALFIYPTDTIYGIGCNALNTKSDEKIRKKCVSDAVNKRLGTLGVRIPNHWIKDFANEMGVPIVTTSVNKSGSDFMTSMDDLDAEIKNSVDFILDEGEIKGKPSKIVDLRDKAKIVKRG